MIFIVYILLTVYVLVYFVSRPTTKVVTTKKRLAMYACVLSLLMLGQTFYSVRTPPRVNYYETGWYGFIQVLNARFAANGIALRIPMPDTP